MLNFQKQTKHLLMLARLLPALTGIKNLSRQQGKPVSGVEVKGLRGK